MWLVPPKLLGTPRDLKGPRDPRDPRDPWGPWLSLAQMGGLPFEKLIPVKLRSAHTGSTQ